METRVSYAKWGKCKKHQGLQTWSKGKNLSIIILLSFLSPLGLPFDVFLYPLQSSFLVRSWLGTVGPRALTGDPAGKTRDLRPKIRNYLFF